MGNIFIGLMLVFLDFNLETGSSVIGLIPDFLGYIFIISGLSRMSKESKIFITIKPYAIGMAIYTSVLYVLDLLGFSEELGIAGYALSIASTVIFLFILYNIIMGVIEVEKKYNTNLNGDKLRSTWMLLVVFNVLAYVFLVFPLITLVSIIANFIVHIYFLIIFNRSKYLYYNVAR